jgi:hypothetical protein
MRTRIFYCLLFCPYERARSGLLGTPAQGVSRNSLLSLCPLEPRRINGLRTAERSRPKPSSVSRCLRPRRLSGEEKGTGERDGTSERLPRQPLP